VSSWRVQSLNRSITAKDNRKTQSTYSLERLTKRWLHPLSSLRSCSLDSLINAIDQHPKVAAVAVVVVALIVY
jgi:hypothetical protein